METQQTNFFAKITKWTLVIYCLVTLVMLITLTIVSFQLTNFSYVCAFLLCIVPGFLFVFISCYMPISKLFGAKAGKGVIAWYCVAYVLKYAAIIGIPFVGLTYSAFFNRWVMLATTLIAPITVIISKVIFANIVSKKSQK